MQWETMAAVLAHELRNPLAGAVAHLELLRETLDPDDPRLRSVEAIDGELSRLAGTLGALLAYGRCGRPRRIRVSPHRILSEVWERARSRGAAAGIRVELEAAPGAGALQGDPVLLERVLENLVDNAFRAVAPGSGVIRLSLRRDGEEVLLAVGDNGSGIAPADLARIFEPFFTRASRGLGLGLALARRVVAGHGGEITVASEPGRGSIFTLRLPRRGSGRREGAVEASRGAALPG